MACTIALLFGGCASRMPAPVVDRSPRVVTVRPPAIEVRPGTPINPAANASESDSAVQTYTVKRGDTLAVIALDHGLDYRELAQWNNIENVNLIRVGQVLRLSAPGEGNTTASVQPAAAPGAGVVTAPLRTAPSIVPSIPAAANSSASAALPAASEKSAAAPPPVVVSRNSENYKSQPKALKEPYSERALREMQQRANTAFSLIPPTAVGTPGAGPVPAMPGSATAAASATTPSPAAPNAPVSPAAVPGGLARSEPPVAPKVDAKSEIKTDAKIDPKAANPAVSDTDDETVDWVWPATGKLVTGFSDSANLKGIDIAGKVGQPVLASAGGKVVYAGTGLRGYGKLIIIKHSKAYLSAYAHNKDILVKEGQQVSRGQKIAEMGSTDADQVKLHFEIRRLGKPMDPLRFLPPA